jgi:hypothetical protein
MTQPGQAYTHQEIPVLGFAALVMPKRETPERDAAVDPLREGLHSIVVQWAHGKSVFGWVRSVGSQHVEIRVRDGSDEDSRALIFSIAPLPQGRITQEFLVSTEGRGLLGEIKAQDSRVLASLRAPRELWSWSDLKHFIEQQAPLLTFLGDGVKLPPSPSLSDEA